jgi:hypothetical protein
MEINQKARNSITLALKAFCLAWVLLSGMFSPASAILTRPHIAEMQKIISSPERAEVLRRSISEHSLRDNVISTYMIFQDKIYSTVKPEYSTQNSDFISNENKPLPPLDADHSLLPSNQEKNAQGIPKSGIIILLGGCLLTLGIYARKKLKKQ